MNRLSLIAALGLWAVAGCADEPGDVEVVVEAEDPIIEGLQPGSNVENIADGWQVSFDRYTVSIGAVDFQLASDPGVTAGGNVGRDVDLTSVPASGAALLATAGLDAGDWEFFYTTTGYVVLGSLDKPDGESCPPRALAEPGAAVPNGNTNADGDPCYDNPSMGFELETTDTTRYGPCEVDGVPGFTVPAGGTATVAATIHGDHLFFNGFPEGGEGGVIRLAQWLADCDLDLDGMVTMTELATIAPSDLVEIDARYQLGGTPITPLDTMATYVRAQLSTQGHFQGEGECPGTGTTTQTTRN